MSALPSRREAAAPGRFGRWFAPLRLVVLVAAIAVAAKLLWPLFFPPQPQIRTAMVVEEVRTAAKLATVELQATVVANRDESTWYGSKFLFMIVPGKAAVGIDLEGLTDDAVAVSGGSVTVTLPRPKVLYVDVDLPEVQVYSAVGLLRPQFTPEETRLLLAESQQKLRAKAEQEAVLKRAETQTVDLLRKLLTAAGAKSVEIRWAS
ncbi:MAG TPA: DUF4230 domain-containing protein [Symbiobacteriaceae bacterium]|nr:DUF4230 domain-containing protein [Symbiobacteriaceae bacterium]